jgi:hypothetical protein
MEIPSVFVCITQSDGASPTETGSGSEPIAIAGGTSDQARALVVAAVRKHRPM